MSETGEQGYTPENPEVGPDDNVEASPASQQAIQAEESPPPPEADAAKSSKRGKSDG